MKGLSPSRIVGLADSFRKDLAALRKLINQPEAAARAEDLLSRADALLGQLQEVSKHWVNHQESRALGSWLETAAKKDKT